MDNASNNAKDMINRLTLQYNRGRQAAITNELVDIITGLCLLRLSIYNHSPATEIRCKCSVIPLRHIDYRPCSILVVTTRVPLPSLGLRENLSQPGIGIQVAAIMITSSG